MENIKNVVLYLIFVAIVVGGYFIFFSNENSQEEQKAEKIEEVDERDMLANELAQKYNAVIDWQENLDYTLEVQERIVIDRPVLFQGYVDDIFSRNDQIFVRFFSSFWSPADFILELECSRPIVDKILAQKENFLGYFDEYAIVANIQDVAKPFFALKGSALWQGEDEVEIDIEPSKLFTARGVCIDIVYMDEGNPSNE